MCATSFWRKVRPTPLVFIFCFSSCCSTFGLCIAIYDINNYGSGLYLALVSIVTVVVVVAFCLVGTEDQDNYYHLPTRDTCAYRMNETERQHLFYEEDNMPIYDIIYQCQRYQEYCCGLNCCKIDQIGHHDAPRKPPKYPWVDPSHLSARSSSLFPTAFAFLTCLALTHF